MKLFNRIESVSARVSNFQRQISLLSGSYE
jgi:hypothetical protein